MRRIPLLLLLFLLTAAASGQPLDAAFGTDGRTLLHLEGSDEAHDVLLDDAGRIVVLGTAEGACGVARLLPDGTPDATFGDGGAAVVDWVGSTRCSAARGGVLLADGSLVTAGDAQGRDLALLRLSPDGTPDPAFGAGGLVTVDVAGGDAIGHDVAQAADGSLVAAGSLNLDGGYAATDGVFVARLAADGTLRTSFGTDGVAAVASSAAAHAVALAADGGIVVAGEHGLQLAVWRFTPGGALDAAFGAGGLVELPNTRSGADVIVQPDGAILVAGTAGSDVSPRAAVFRLRPDGSLDASFGDGGVAEPAGRLASYGRGLAVGPGGRIALVGQALATPSESDLFAALLEADGTSVAAFGDAGVATSDLGHDYREWASAAVVDASGGLVAAGQTWGDGWDYAVVRYASGNPTTGVEDAASAPLVLTHAPNPVHGAATFRYAVPAPEHVTLRIYDLLGRRVATLVDGPAAAGPATVRFDAASLPAGVYLCRLQAGRHERTTRLVVTR